MTTTDYIKNGDVITPKVKGCDYNLESGKVYDLKFNPMTGESFLTLNGDLNVPKKVYDLPGDLAFMERVNAFFNSSISEQTTGVLLSGTKGTGKSMLAKRLAEYSQLPIVIPDFEFRIRYLDKFFKGLKQPVCIILDEFEKNDYYWPSSEILSFLDGIQSSCKKLVIMTCNNSSKLDSNLIDRCSRIRYKREYDNNSNDVFVKSIILDKNLQNVDLIEDFIKTQFKVKSFDNINSFLNELVFFHKDENVTKDLLFDVVNSMNIGTVNSPNTDETPKTSSAKKECIHECDCCC